MAQVEALARAGAVECLGVDRRQALWQAGVAATEKPGMLPGLSAIDAPALPGMSAFELLATNIAATGVTPEYQPMALLRQHLERENIVPAHELLQVADGTRVKVAGIITHRQRPRTASGLTFLGLEDETGLLNVMVSVGLWNRQRLLARTAKALIIRGDGAKYSRCCVDCCGPFRTLGNWGVVKPWFPRFPMIWQSGHHE